jgi:pimeloyl-ACP methyl ester carboxylesterase
LRTDGGSRVRRRIGARPALVPPSSARRAAAVRVGALLLLASAAAAGAAGGPPTAAAPADDRLRPCRLPGVEHDAQCGTLRRPLDPAQPGGAQIDVHFAVLPALARNKKADPVFFFAGGPGQSAIDVAASIGRVFARVANRRDLVFVDQRGTGRSAPLACEPPAPTRPLAEAVDPERQVARLARCRERLQALPHGDLRHYATWVAAQDADAVRQALGAAQVNLVGGSYGTRAALEFQRQFPQAVRRAVLDGVAPPDMVLPASFSPDNQAALDALFTACAAEPACRSRHPTLRADWQRLLASLPREAAVVHPVTGAPERLTLTREAVLGLVRGPLYVPALASALPLAIGESAHGRFEPLVGLASALQGARAPVVAEGLHFSVVCSEDAPRLAQAADAPGADFGSGFADLYRRVCADWPRGPVPDAFYTLPAAPAATLVLSGGADPATPPRHGERVVRALGARARHVVVPEAGHGVMALPCLRDVLFRFIDAADDTAALAVDADCARALPRPRVFVPVAPEGGR